MKVDIGAWVTTGTTYMVDCNLAVELLEAIDETACLSFNLFAIGLCIEEGAAAEFCGMASQAKNLASFWIKATDARAKVSGLTDGFAELPLSTTRAHLQQWLSSVGAFVDDAANFLLKESASATAAAAAQVDSTCPRWGDAINDVAIREDSAKLLLVMNTKLAGLPKHCRELQTSLETLMEVAQILFNKGVHDLDGCREEARVAGHALSFGKRTVNVSAAVKVLFSEPMNVSALRAVMAFKGTLPAALAHRLDLALQKIDGAPPEAASASSSAGGGAAASSSGEKGGIKRPRSGILGLAQAAARRKVAKK